MKKLLLIISSIMIGASLWGAKLDESKLLMRDFENLENLKDVNISTTTAADDMKSISIDTGKIDGKSSVIFSTKAGMFEAGKPYTVRLKYKLTRDDVSKMPFMKIRAIGGNGQLLNQYHLGASKSSSFAKLTFTPSADDNAAYISIISSGVFKATISSFSIEASGGEKFYPIIPDAKPYSEKLDNIPTGSEEFNIDLPRPEKEIVVNAADFGLNDKVENAATIMNKAIARCKEIGASKLIVPTGRYKMFENVKITLDNFTDFTLDAQGSTFVARKTETANLGIFKCLRTKVCNFNMDYDWETEPLAAIVEVTDVKIDTTAKTTAIFVKFLEYDKYPLYGKQVRVANMENYDPKAKAVGQEGGKSFGFGFGPSSPSPAVEWKSPNLMSINCTWINDRAEVGKQYRLQHYYYGMGGIELMDNTHLTLENVEIYSCKGHGILCNGEQEYFQFLNVNIRPPKGSQKRAITCTADHLHFARSKGHFKMIGCEFCLGSDDCINIHDLSAFGVKCDENVIQLKAGSMPAVGDIVELRQGDYSPTKFKSEVVNVTNQGKDMRFIYFKDKVPDPKQDGFLLFNRKYDSSHVVIKDCYFHSNRARGLLILASNMTIENCKFYHNQMGALKFETGYTFNVWSEGFGVNNILVRNCDFNSVNPQGVKYQNKVRDVFMGVYMRNDPSLEQTKFPVISNILFENNKFKDSYGVIALISSSNNITFRDNTFENVTPRIVEMPYRGAFYINHSTNTKIINNTWIKSALTPNAGIFVDEDTSKNIIFEGNKIVEK